MSGYLDELAYKNHCLGEENPIHARFIDLFDACEEYCKALDIIVYWNSPYNAKEEAESKQKNALTIIRRILKEGKE